MKQVKFKVLYRREWYLAHETHFYEDGSMWINSLIGPDGIICSDSDHIKAVVQFTGVVDKNLIEVYEGDIIKYSHSKDSKEYTGEVFWKEDSACYFIRTSPDSGFALLGHQKIVEKIGSIFDK